MRIPLSEYPPWASGRQSFTKENVFHAHCKTERFAQEGSASTRSGSCEAHGAGQPRLAGFRQGLRIRDERFYSVVLFRAPTGLQQARRLAVPDIVGVEAPFR